MKKLVIVLLVVGAVGYGLKLFGDARNPAVITDPVYAEVRIVGDAPGGQVELDHTGTVKCIRPE